jgi:hypothetical protein
MTKVVVVNQSRSYSGMTICVVADGKKRTKKRLDVRHGCPEGYTPHETEEDHCNWTDVLDDSRNPHSTIMIFPTLTSIG